MTHQPRRGTLAYLATDLGVSRTTISNAYNKPDHLSPELREKILKRAKEIGYAGPDPTARSLRTRHTGALGILLTDAITHAFDDLASLDFITGVSHACQELGSSMLVIPADAGAEDTDQQAGSLVGQAGVDGFIVYSVAEGDPFLKAVQRRTVPVVICDQPKNEANTPFVGIDDFRAIQPAAQAVVDQGHSTVGILCIRLDRTEHNGFVTAERLEHAHMDTQKQRILGALDVLKKAGVDTATVPIVERFINTPESTRSAAQELLDTHPELTAVICTTDSMALGVLEYAQDKGLSVPEDLSVTGFDGIRTALDSGLTTVIQPNVLKGKRSGELLGELIAQQEHAEGLGTGTLEPRSLGDRIVLETEFVPGSTVGPAR